MRPFQTFKLFFFSLIVLLAASCSPKKKEQPVAKADSTKQSLQKLIRRRQKILL